MKITNKTLIASGTMLALSIMLVAGLSFASADGSRGGGWHGFNHGNMDQRLEAKAELFGITPEALRERLDVGEKLYEVAESFGTTQEEMQISMHAVVTEHIEQLRADGTITDERADEMLERVGEGGFRKGARAFHKGFVGGFDGNHQLLDEK